MKRSLWVQDLTGQGLQLWLHVGVTPARWTPYQWYQNIWGWDQVPLPTPRPRTPGNSVMLLKLKTSAVVQMRKYEGFRAVGEKGQGMGWDVDEPLGILWLITHEGEEEEEKIERVIFMHSNPILCVSASRYSFFVAMGYLTICHISRIYIFHYGILTTDFSGWVS